MQPGAPVQDLLAQAKAAREQSDLAQAAHLLEKALEIDFDCRAGHIALAHIRFPGESYIQLLARIHHTRRPRTYIEIGVANGSSIAQALPGCRRIGIDPAPTLTEPAPGVEVYCTTSDRLFATADVRKILGGLPLDLAFIDGMHLFEYVLADFVNLERYCTADSTILIHDCLPLNAVVAERDRRTQFWLGDVWRILPTLAHFRPDLSISVVAAPPSGLAVVRRLDPASDVLNARRAEALSFGAALPFTASQSLATLGIKQVPSDWQEVSRLFAA